MKVIEITIDPTGKSTIQTKGFTGAECRDVSKPYEQALGQQSSEQLTGEFYQSQPPLPAPIKQSN